MTVAPILHSTAGAGSPAMIGLNVSNAEHSPASALVLMSLGQPMVAAVCTVNVPAQLLVQPLASVRGKLEPPPPLPGEQGGDAREMAPAAPTPVTVTARLLGVPSQLPLEGVTVTLRELAAQL